ncbi:protein arginine kinase [Acetonema longum]|uniref:Protein-arginine kinase n=1 Tax=Acetonema longum DSM 6540 TaxID=1009370 RepID=F7NM73_9FIRM|nr:protein arginine kinase [Acetonema longum]EGO62874.1 ATP:guanido phosphotransferase [Acetonema longum DSM 6540]
MLLQDLLDQPQVSWMKPGAKDGDIVLSSRIRLARNLADIPFPGRAEAGQLQQTADQIHQSVSALAASDRHEYLFIPLEQLTPLDRLILVEKHITSPNHVQESKGRALLVRDDSMVSIMVNEEDHLRVQCMMPGANLSEAFALADRVDDVLEAEHDYAYSERLGYLTSCPTNIGTGLRASAMLHLPVLVLTKQIQRVVNAATQLGLAVRGIYGEGTEAVGNIFQISNQLTLGYSEAEIIENLTSVVQQVVDQERAARSALMAESRSLLADRIWRAYGILRFARSISGQEALAMLSEVRLGIDLKIIENLPAEIFNELLVATRPNFLQKRSGGENDPAARDRYRAELIREKLSAFEIKQP